jgi:hypothetical protein
MPIMARSQVPITASPSGAPGTSLAYITIGAIMAVLAGTSYFFFDGSANAFVGYLRTSFLVLGIVLIVIGFTVGRIGRAARKAELPPTETTNPVIQS